MVSSITTPVSTSSPIGPLRRWVALIGLSLTFGLVQLDATIVNVGLQTLRADLGGGVAAAQWVVDGYAVPFAALLLIAGAISDRLGHRRSCLAGLLIFAAASIAATFATGWAILIAARVLQGLGAAAMLPSSLAMTSQLFPEPRARARALGVWGGIATLGFAAGPALGGLLITWAGWPAVFAVNVPAVVVIAIVIATLVPADNQPLSIKAITRLDPIGAILATVLIAAVAGAVIEAGQRSGPGLVSGVVLLAVGICAGRLLIRNQRSTKSPLIPGDLLNRPAFRWSLVAGFSFNFAMYGTLLCVSLTLQADYGYSALAGGFAIVPMALVVSVGAVCSGLLTSRLGPRRPMLAGFAAVVVGTMIMVVGALTAAPGVMIAGLTVSGCCALAMPAMTSVALGAGSSAQSGLAGGALNTMRQLGGALGVAVLGAVLNSAGYRGGLAIASVLAGMAGALGMISAIRSTTTRAAEGDR